LGEIEKAAETCKKGLNVNPNDPRLLLNLGMIDTSTNRVDSAIINLNRMIDLSPQWEEVYLLLAANYIQGQQYKRAEYILTRMVEIHPRSILGLYYLGRVYTYLMLYEKAEKQFNLILNEDPFFDRAYEGLALNYLHQRRYGQAAKIFARLVKQFPGEPRYRKLLVQVQELEKPGKSGPSDDGEKLEPEKPLEPELLKVMALVFFQDKDYFKALEYFQLAVYQNPKNHRLKYFIAETFDILDMYDLSVQYWESILRANPKSVDILLHLAQMYEKSGKMDLSLMKIQEAIDQNPKDPDLYYYMAIGNSKQKHYDRSVENLKKAIELDNRQDEYHFYLGTVYEKMGEVDLCIESMKEAIRLNPNHPNALNYLGYLYAERDTNLEEAYAYVIQAIRVEPNNGYFIDSLGWIYYKQGKYVEALDTILKAIRYVPPDPTIFEHLGDIYLKLQKYDKASEAYQKSLEVDGENKAIWEKLQNTNKLLSEPAVH
jgi:tetratricopeptide (TPR) repeat protein